MTVTGLVPLAVRGRMPSWASRPLRFAGTGGTAGATQILLLILLTRLGVEPFLANVIAFLLAAQVNFILSTTVTWGDRAGGARCRRRWLLFHGSISLMALVNMLTFLLARTVLATAPAALLGIAAGAVGNYVLGDRLVFRSARVETPVSSRGLRAAR